MGNIDIDPMTMLLEGVQDKRVIIATDKPVLHTICNKIEDPNEGQRIIDLLEDALFDRQINQYRGVGLAAPQIGIGKSVAIIRYGDISIDMINPKIISHSPAKSISIEECLSLPGKKCMVQRWHSIELKTDNNDVINIEDVSLARMVQHEVDHLYGRLITDNIVMSVKMGRNDKCPCGSGKKYKKCCLNRQ
jgi:peptide deformylase